MILRNGMINAGSALVTGLSRTSDLTVGMYVYKNGFPVCTKIKTIDSSSQITLTQLSALTGIFSIEFSANNPDVRMERCMAMRDVKSVVDERGDILKIIIRAEKDVSRDAYNSVQKRDQERVIFMKAFPIETRPSDKQLEKAGIREKTDLTAWTASMDWINAGIGFDGIEFATRTTVVWQGNVYEIRDKGLVNQIGDSFLYITLGLVKR
jgi:hypothetical protein